MLHYGIRQEKSRKPSSPFPSDVIAASKIQVMEEYSPRKYAFLQEGGGVIWGPSPSGRFVYGTNGFTLWCQANGYIYASDGLHQLFSVAKEGEEPQIAFFLNVGAKVISLLPVPYLKDGAKRFTIFYLHAAYYFTEWKDITSIVRVTASPDNQLLFSIFISFKQPRSNCRLLTYFSPHEKNDLSKSDEDRWFLTTKTTHNLKKKGSSQIIIPASSLIVYEDPDRNTSLTHLSLLRGSCAFRGTRFLDYQTTTARNEFVGGNNRNLNNAVALNRLHFPNQRLETVFNDKGIFSNAIFFESKTSSNARFDFAYQRISNQKELSKLSTQPILSTSIDKSISKIKSISSKNKQALKFKGCFNPKITEIKDQDFFPFLTNLQHQVAVCSEIKGYMQLAPRSLVGIRDVFQALEAYLYFAPQMAKRKILEGLSYTCPDGRCLRQYLPGSLIADTREFIDQGLWIIKTVVEYIKASGDRSFLDQKVGYHQIIDDNPYLGTISPIKKKDTVLDHLIKILFYLIKNINPKTNLLMALYGDWNDALDGLGFTKKKGKKFGTGTTVMGSLQLYQNCNDMLEVLNWLNLESKYKKEISLYKKTKKKILNGLIKNSLLHKNNKKRISHGFGDDEKYTVGGFNDPDGKSRYSLTSNAYWIISGVHKEALNKSNQNMLPQILEAYDVLDDKYGLRTFYPAFERGTEHWFGRIPRLPEGTAENGATYNHATLFGIWSLFQIGESGRAWAQLEKLLPFTSIHKNYNLTPFVIPNSYIKNLHKGLDGESMNDWQTGSSNVLLKIIIWYVFGFRPEINHLRIQPDPLSPLNNFNFQTNYQNKTIEMIYRKSSSTQERKVQLNGKPLKLYQDDEMKILVTDINRKHLKKENQIRILDPKIK